MNSALRRTSVVVIALAVAAGVAGCAPQGDKTVTFRLWDPNVAEAYEQSFARFEKVSGITVDTVVVPWADYWTQLRADVAAGTMDDLFWVNATAVQDLAEADRILAVEQEQIDAQARDWAPNVVDQYTFDGRLWGVPQLTDPGIAVLVNDDLIRDAGIDPAQLDTLAWDPHSHDDSLRRVARALTLDAQGRRPGDPGFDAATIRQYGYGASSDLNAILLPFLGSIGASWQQGDDFAFDSPAAVAAIGYVVDLINDEHVAPNAADTNPPAGGDFVRDQFLQGTLALFQTGAYSLPDVSELASFDWSIVPLPQGPRGRISVTNGIVVAASASSPRTAQQQAVLRWLGSADGVRALGATGSTLPAVLSAQQPYFDYWAAKGTDLTPMIDVLAGDTVQPPQGARYQAASDAIQPILNDVFLARRPVEDGLTDAVVAGNSAMLGP